MATGDKKYLILILLLYLSLTVMYSSAVPLWEAPDEPSHYLCIRRFSDGRAFRPPRPTGPLRDDWSEKHLYSLYQRSQPPLYYLMAAPVMKVLACRRLPLGDEIALPPVRPDFNREGSLFIHGRDTVFSLPPSDVRGHLLRLFSIFWGCVTIFFIYRIAWVVSPRIPAVAFCSGAFVATLPQFNFISGAIGNDSLAAALGAATLLFLVRRVGKETPVRPRDYLGLGVLLLISLLTKFNLIFLLPLSLIFICLKAKDEGTWRSGLAGLVLTLLPLILGMIAAVALFPRDLLLKTRILGFRLLGTDPYLVTAPHLRYLIRTIYRSFFATFGWMSIRVGGRLYLAWGLICVAGLLGWVKALFRRSGGEERRGRQLGLLAAAFIILLIGVMKNNLLVHQSQGRFLFPALGAIAVLLSSGILNLFRERSREIAAIGCMIIFLVLNLIAFFVYLVPASY